MRLSLYSTKLKCIFFYKKYFSNSKVFFTGLLHVTANFSFNEIFSHFFALYLKGFPPATRFSVPSRNLLNSKKFTITDCTLAFNKERKNERMNII